MAHVGSGNGIGRGDARPGCSRVKRAAWRREMAELERTWAIASAHAEGVAIRKIAQAAGLGATRVHAIVKDAMLDGLDAALGELRSLSAGRRRRTPTAAVTRSSPDAS